MRKAEGIKELFLLFCVKRKDVYLSISQCLQTPSLASFPSFVFYFIHSFYCYRVNFFLAPQFSFSFLFFCLMQNKRAKNWQNGSWGTQRKCLLKKKWKFFLIKKNAEICFASIFFAIIRQLRSTNGSFFAQFIPSPLTPFST